MGFLANHKLLEAVCARYAYSGESHVCLMYVLQTSVSIVSHLPIYLSLITSYNIYHFLSIIYHLPVYHLSSTSLTIFHLSVFLAKIYLSIIYLYCCC